MVDIKDYPKLVDTIWEIVQSTSKVHEREYGNFSQEHISKKLGIPHTPTGQVLFDDTGAIGRGIAPAIHDLVELGYCKAEIKYPEHHWFHISPSPDAPMDLPSVVVLQSLQKPFITNGLLPLHEKVLQIIHNKTVHNAQGITLDYNNVTCMYKDLVQILSAEHNKYDITIDESTVRKILKDLQEWPLELIKGRLLGSAFRMWITLKGAVFFSEIATK